MKTTYLVWKNPACNGIAPDWQELTGREFLALVRSPEGKNRHFVKLLSTEDGGGDGVFVMEATKAEYAAWRREKKRHDYLRNWDKDVTVISYHTLASEDDESYGEEQLADDGLSVEARFIKSHELEMAWELLNDEEKHLVTYLHLSDKPLTVRAYGEMTNTPKSTVSRRQKAVLEKLKKFFES